MSWPVVVHPEADAEIEEAAAWYEARRPGLGLEFLAAVDRVVVEVGEHPVRYAEWTPPWRRVVLRRFPYLVFYEFEGRERVVVYAVAHAKRKPGYWAARRPPTSP